MANIFKKLKYLSPLERTEDGHRQTNKGGREWEQMYRDRWSFDKCVRSTHGVNCTGSCSWNIYVKNGLVAWENQVHDYPETSPEVVRVAQVFRGICTARTEFAILICAESWRNCGVKREKTRRRHWKRGKQLRTILSK